MPQSKRPRKKYKPITSVKPRKIMSTDEQIKQLYGDKLPYCKICGTKCVRATDEEVLDYKNSIQHISLILYSHHLVIAGKLTLIGWKRDGDT